MGASHEFTFHLKNMPTLYLHTFNQRIKRLIGHFNALGVSRAAFDSHRNQEFHHEYDTLKSGLTAKVNT
ncbi:hypothetical protein [Synechococcus sp. MIT S1220]|uniref:hypothetical protein n=1 Tax=Synechococcus sp. MIT S1220 TaxID=3082549 RepID=UPI0039B0A2F3